mmetsp:Transcript_20101/g.51278  ORF Transcript_20101/g.51278 Transcript_20101/m.51278 type:complete len:117 (-) Transcript_20101:212-562(-)
MRLAHPLHFFFSFFGLLSSPRSRMYPPIHVHTHEFSFVHTHGAVVVLELCRGNNRYYRWVEGESGQSREGGEHSEGGGEAVARSDRQVDAITFRSPTSSRREIEEKDMGSAAVYLF